MTTHHSTFCEHCGCTSDQSRCALPCACHVLNVLVKKNPYAGSMWRDEHTEPEIRKYLLEQVKELHAPMSAGGWDLVWRNEVLRVLS